MTISDARRFALRILQRWIGDAAQRASALLVVSELVINAAEHALPPATLHLHRRPARDQLWVGVTDGGPACCKGPWISSCIEKEQGRGPLLIGALATAYGWYTDRDGRTTHWARLAAA
jgi:anti-sigma regulatory factor (Ser/Thr protein kinase)